MIFKTTVLTPIQRFSLRSGLLINGGSVNIRRTCPREITAEGIGSGECTDTVPEWHKRNLVTLFVVH